MCIWLLAGCSQPQTNSSSVLQGAQHLTPSVCFVWTPPPHTHKRTHTTTTTTPGPAPKTQTGSPTTLTSLLIQLPQHLPNNLTNRLHGSSSNSSSSRHDGDRGKVTSQADSAPSQSVDDSQPPAAWHMDCTGQQLAVRLASNSQLSQLPRTCLAHACVAAVPPMLRSRSRHTAHMRRLCAACWLLLLSLVPAARLTWCHSMHGHSWPTHTTSQPTTCTAAPVCVSGTQLRLGHAPAGP